MDRIQWIVRCNRSLAKRRPDIDAAIIEHIAIELWRAYQHEQPEGAAEREAGKWLPPPSGFAELPQA